MFLNYNFNFISFLGPRNDFSDQAFIQEVSIIHFLNQKFPMYFVQLYGYELETQTMLLKYYDQGSLAHYLQRNNSRWTRQVALTIIHDVAMGLMSMHSEGMAHRDLKPENILIDIRQNTAHAVLTDFGISAILESNLVKVKEFQVANAEGFSPLYCAPEIFEITFETRDSSKELFMQSDIYSFACLIYVCMGLKPPWVPHESY